MKILVINGVNLNKLGEREVDIYGNETLEDVEFSLKKEFEKEHKLEFFQSNIEGELVAEIQNYKGDVLVINAGAYSHYSVALHDALKMKKCLKVEVHISNVFAREEFRHKSVIAPVCNAYVCGFGTKGYSLAISGALSCIKK